MNLAIHFGNLDVAGINFFWSQARVAAFGVPDYCTQLACTLFQCKWSSERSAWAPGFMGPVAWLFRPSFKGGSNRHGFIFI